MLISLIRMFRLVGSILKRVAYGIAHYIGFVHLAALTAEVSFFHVFLRIVPRTSCVSHEDSQHETAAQSADKQSQHAGNTEDQSRQNGAIIAISEGTTISRCAPLVEIATQRS